MQFRSNTRIASVIATLALGALVNGRACADQVPLTAEGGRSKYEHDRPSSTIRTVVQDPETGIRSRYEHDRPSLVIRRVRRRFADASLGSEGLIPIPEYLRSDRPEKYEYDHPAAVVRRFYGMETPPAESLDDPIVQFQEDAGLIDVIRNHGRLVRADKPILRAALASEKIARAVRISDREISLVGLVHGSTSLTLWLEGEAQPRHIVVRVGYAAGARAWILGSLGRIEGVE